MPYETIVLDREETYAVITLNRPPANAISETLMEMTVKPICRAPSKAARTGEWPFSRLRNTFSITTIASSTTKPTEIASAPMTAGKMSESFFLVFFMGK